MGAFSRPLNDFKVTEFLCYVMCTSDGQKCSGHQRCRIQFRTSDFSCTGTIPLNFETFLCQMKTTFFMARFKKSSLCNNFDALCKLQIKRLRGHSDNFFKNFVLSSSEKFSLSSSALNDTEIFSEPLETKF